uniref:HEAT repeat-containing protein 1 n=1 Tax=Meloidogyne hapla TaxID=6305 RepID=A0A1I8BWF4_MELHA
MAAKIDYECPDLLQSEVLETIQDCIDEAFIRQYVEVLFKKDGHGLKELHQSILECDKSQISRQTLLSFYVGVLIKVIQNSSDAIEVLKRSEVLQIFQQFILPSIDSYSSAVDQHHFTLKVLLYELILEMYRKQISENHWPFQLDISNMIIYPLANESTPISFRKIIEQLAILHINSVDYRTLKDSDDLINQLVQVLLAADFTLVYTSCTRILSTSRNAANILLSLGHGIPIIQKAKKLKKIEQSFAQLAADLIFNSTNFNENISDGFKDRFTHTLILVKLAEHFSTMRKIGSQYSEDSSQKWRFSLNEDALLAFVRSLLDVHSTNGEIENTITLLFQQYILPHLLLFTRLIEISIGASNEFLRLPAFILLTRLFKKELIESLLDVWRANSEEQIKKGILKFTLKQLNDLNAGVTEKLISDHRKTLINGVVALLDCVEPEEEESLSVIRMSVQICEALCTDFGINEINGKWIMLKKQMELIERRHYERNVYEKTTTIFQINEMIDNLKHGCNINNDSCGTKDCY